MRGKKFTAILFAALLLIMTSCGSDGLDKESSKTVEQINKAMERSIELTKGSLETNVTQGDFYKDIYAEKMLLEFEVAEANKDKSKQSLAFKAVFTYGGIENKVENVASYEGIYLNLFYPYLRYNKINTERVESVTTEKTDEGTEYFVYYKDSHRSRRIEWDAGNVIQDYEYFMIDNEGVIVEYESNIDFEYTDEGSEETLQEKSIINVKLTEYSL